MHRSGIPALLLAASALAMPPALADSHPRPWLIVSDVDDTVKITEVQYPLNMIWRALFSKKSFAGMSALIRELRGARLAAFGNAGEVHFASGTPRFLSGNVREFLDHEGFPEDAVVHLRPDFTEPTLEFKTRVITGVLERATDESAVLIGDDVEKDPEVYAIVRAANPESVSAAYLHRVRGRPLAEGQIGYDTAMDIALHEVASGRLGEDQALRVAAAVESESRGDDERLILNYSYCPESGSPRATDEVSRLPLSPGVSEAVLGAARRIEDRTREICRERRELEEYRRLHQAGG